ncbi:MAG TPA: HAD-IC family P-type ATPase [Candidatus Limnocylindrales bacterium]|nr:HAD-IC family P-type ATPase [Candidatus Limnocylindrales bacterium]
MTKDGAGAPASAASAAAPAAQAWHGLTPEATLAAQAVDQGTGLTAAEVQARRATYGPNRFAEAAKEPTWQRFVRQYRDPMQIVLLVAGIVSLFIPNQFATGIVLIALTLLNAFLGLNQEGKAEASVAALQKMMVVKAKARRDGTMVEVPMEELVPGDIVNIEAGDLVPADGRIIRAATLEIDESALTGESQPVPKTTDAVPADAALGDRIDMAFMNTQVTRGAATFVVTSTGMATEVGHISDMLQATTTESTPLTKQLNALTNQILIIAGVALIASIALGKFHGQPFDALFLTAVAFAVSAIPTGLPAVVTTILAAGTSTLAAAGAIVKRLRSVETLGSTSAINSDKTGTLTLNQMTAVEMAIAGQRFTISGEGYSTQGTIAGAAGRGEVPLERYLLPMALCADAQIKDGGLVGDPTEGALVVLAAKGGVDPTLTRERYPRIAEVPFDAAYKLMATFHEMDDESGKPVIRCYVKGAPDQLLARASGAIRPDGTIAPIADLTDRYMAENERLGSQGLRVMATGQRDLDPATFDRTAADLLPLVSDLTLLALVGIVDPPRPEAKVAIQKAHAAGIQVRMITGDHAVTAEAIARQLGITGRAITGAEFAAMDDATVDREIDDVGVIARVAPEDKVHLVDILKRKGHVVAMTGDGVNDAPALKKADIGVAMGITGTEVSKEAAVMILTDDNFATIVRAVELGRALYDNLVRYIRFQMACLFGFIGTFLGSSLLWIAAGTPFLPLQTLWINFTVQVFLAVGLGYGKPRAGLMGDAPRPPSTPILPPRLMAWLIFAGGTMAIVTLAVIAWATPQFGDPAARTMGLTAFSIMNIWFALETSDEQQSLFSAATLANPTLLKAAALAAVAVVATSELGLLNRILDTVNMTTNQWGIAFVASLAIVVVAEGKKLLKIRTTEDVPRVNPEAAAAPA